MAKNDKCPKCPMSVGGKPDTNSDYCDACQFDPDTGWGGYTDNSDSDEETNHHY